MATENQTPPRMPRRRLGWLVLVVEVSGDDRPRPRDRNCVRNCDRDHAPEHHARDRGWDRDGNWAAGWVCAAEQDNNAASAADDRGSSSGEPRLPARGHTAD